MSDNAPYGAIGSKFGSKPNGFFFDRLQEIKTMTVYVIADIKVTDDGWVPLYAASVHDIVHKHGGKYLSRSGKVKTSSGYHLYSASGVSIGGSSQGLRHRSQIRSLRRGPAGRQRKPPPADRRHRCGGNNSLSAKRMIRQSKPPRTTEPTMTTRTISVAAPGTTDFLFFLFLYFLETQQN
jgi:hypothetical protein